MKKILVLKKIAFNNLKKKIVTKSDFYDAVGIWWRKKYNLPDTDHRYLDKYEEDMVIEYFEDQFLEDKQAMIAFEKGFNSPEEMEKEELKKIMGDDYTEEVSYFENPPEELRGKQDEEEVIEEFEGMGNG